MSNGMPWSYGPGDYLVNPDQQTLGRPSLFRPVSIDSAALAKKSADAFYNGGDIYQYDGGQIYPTAARGLAALQATPERSGFNVGISLDETYGQFMSRAHREIREAGRMFYPSEMPTPAEYVRFIEQIKKETESMAQTDADRLFSDMMRVNGAQKEAQRKLDLAQGFIKEIANADEGSVITFDKQLAPGGKTYRYASLKVAGVWFMTGQETASRNDTELAMWLCIGVPVESITWLTPSPVERTMLTSAVDPGAIPDDGEFDDDGDDPDGPFGD